jgi:hypothetical protein
MLKYFVATKSDEQFISILLFLNAVFLSTNNMHVTPPPPSYPPTLTKCFTQCKERLNK